MKAIILAGGRGERLSPFTNTCPKGMIEIDGKPILEYQIEWLKKYDVDTIVFACGYLNEVIKDYFGDGKKFLVNIDYSVEEQPLGRGGAIKKAWEKWEKWEKIHSKEPIIVMNGDVFTEMDLNKAIKAHNCQNDIIATICIFPYKSPYGIVRINGDGTVTGFEEKRTLPYWVNGGIYIFEEEVKEYLPLKGDHETTTFPELSKRKLIYGYKSLDYWKGIDTAKDLHEFITFRKSNPVLI